MARHKRSGRLTEVSLPNASRRPKIKTCAVVGSAIGVLASVVGIGAYFYQRGHHADVRGDGTLVPSTTMAWSSQKMVDVVKVQPGGVVEEGPQQLIAQLLDANKGVAIAEMHEDDATRRYLVEPDPETGQSIMDVLAAKRVKYLVMEMVRKEDNQTLLPDYYEGRDDGSKLREALARDWWFTEDGPDLYLRIIEAAKKRGIRVVGGYPSLSKEETQRLEKTPEGMSKLVESIDHTLASVVEALPLGAGDKVATFTGLGHIHGGAKMLHGIPDQMQRENEGIDGLLNLPAVTFLQSIEGLKRPFIYKRDGQYCIYIPATGQSKHQEGLAADRAVIDYLRSPNAYLFDKLANVYNRIADHLNQNGENATVEVAIKNVAAAHRLLEQYGREGKSGKLAREPLQRVAEYTERARTALEKAGPEKESVLEEAHEILKGVQAFITALEARMEPAATNCR